MSELPGGSLPSLDSLFGSEAHRLRGLKSWSDLPLLGRLNLVRLQHLAQEQAYANLARDQREELRELQPGLRELGRLAEHAQERRPMLPRLRVEMFHPGDRLSIFLGDSPGTLVQGWVDARVEKVAKNHRPEWVSPQANSGYFWEVTASAERDLFPNSRQIRFSTTEPRVLPQGEFHYLLWAERFESRFFEIFVENAWRDWTPLWCIDRHTTIDPAKIDYASWLKQLAPR
jgi:hypothetical protein